MTAAKGQRLAISARKWNALDGVIDAHNKGDRPLSFSGDDSSDGIVQVVNDTGANVNARDIVGLTGGEITPTSNLADFQSTINFKGVIPTNEYTGRFAILLDGGTPGAVLPGLLWGEAWVKIALQAANHQFADINPSEKGKLKSGCTGTAQILKAFPSGSSYPQDSLAYVRLGLRAPTAYAAKTGASTIPARSSNTPGSGTVTLYDLNASGVLESLGITETVYNKSTEAVAANAWLTITLEYSRLGPKWFVTWEDCA
jgi:hypothetical protein